MKRRLLVYVVVATVMVFGSAVPAGAQGMMTIPWEDGGECDFEGDGLFSDYETVEGQTVRRVETVSTSPDGVTHAHTTTLLQGVEYTTLDPDAVFDTVFLTGTIVVVLQVSGEDIIGGRLTSSFRAMADGDWIGSGLAVGEFETDGSVTPVVERGPCRFGLDS